MGKTLSSVTIVMESKDAAERKAALRDLAMQHGEIETCKILATAADWRALLAKDKGFVEDAIRWMGDAESWRHEAEDLIRTRDTIMLNSYPHLIKEKAMKPSRLSPPATR